MRRIEVGTPVHSEIIKSAESLSEVIKDLLKRPEKKFHRQAETMIWLLNSGLLTDISGLNWWEDGSYTDFNANPHAPKLLKKTAEEEDMSIDNPRASIYVQGRFDAGPNGRIVLSTRRVPVTIFKVLDKPTRTP